VGTSGWSYAWNPDGLEWYVRNSGLNAVELNSSFYRFPFRSMIRGWSRRTELRWSVKVHRSITHSRMMRTPGSTEVLLRFLELFRPMDEAGIVDFYLFQMPPRFAAGEENWRRIIEVSGAVGLGPRMAIEFRHPSWFEEDGWSAPGTQVSRWYRSTRPIYRSTPGAATAFISGCTGGPRGTPTSTRTRNWRRSRGA